jgi:hypothetical protein
MSLLGEIKAWFTKQDATEGLVQRLRVHDFDSHTSLSSILSELTSVTIPTEYDDIVLTYTGSNLTTVVYKLAAVTLVTLTLTYTGSQLDRVQLS